MSIQTFSTDFGGKKLILETGKYAYLAGAAVTAQYGDTVVLATVTMGKEPREGMSYFPLMVDYEEKLYAAGKIKGSRFIKREGRPTDDAILTGRMIDRTIRPLFPKEMKNDVQVVVTTLAYDQENAPDMLALVAVSAALSISDIPWNGPITGTRIAHVDNSFIVNPTVNELEKSDMEIIGCFNGDKLIMVEADSREASEKVFLDGVKFGEESVGVIHKLIMKMQKEVGKEKYVLPEDDSTEEEKLHKEEVLNKVTAIVKPALKKIYGKPDKAKQQNEIAELKVEIDEALKVDNDVSKDDRAIGVSLLDEMLKKEVRRLTLEDGKRVDGRGIDEIRNLAAETAVLPRVHGSGLFQRGETQVLSVVTLGSPGAEQIIDGMELEYKKHYMHHYNFPGYSVGEVQPNRGAGRREIGHGALAEKAIMPVLPSKEDFPYTIRVVSEVLTSNGSTSQASICGSSLSLMDAGVPLKSSVAGIAMGLVTDSENPDKKFVILTDIQGAEDFSGDMDFKVAGTEKGITAIQMDTKTFGLTYAMTVETIEKAKKAREEILKVMNKAIPESRKELSEHAPRIISLQIDPDKIREVIGPGGKVINEIIDETGVEIDIEDSGLVLITGVGEEGPNKALETIKNIVRVPEAGETYEGTVTRLMDFGAFVEFLPKQEGLVHISKLADKHVDNVSDVVKEGDKVTVKVIEIDSMGRVNLSMRKNDDAPREGKPNRGPRPPRSNGSGGRRNSRDRGPRR